jgi:hypothetical protein
MSPVPTARDHRAPAPEADETKQRRDCLFRQSASVGTWVSSEVGWKSAKMRRYGRLGSWPAAFMADQTSAPVPHEVTGAPDASPNGTTVETPMVAGSRAALVAVAAENLMSESPGVIDCQSKKRQAGAIPTGQVAT